MKKRKKLPFVKWFIKKNNVEHTHTGRFVASGHNRSDKEFLKGNEGLLQKLQRNIA